MFRPPVLSSERATSFGLAVLALLLAFVQRPGRTYLDTRIELTEGPQAFVGQAGSMWSAAVDLGHLQSGQFVGYLFPQGPWFAFVDLLGVPQWIGERLWLAFLLWLAAYGVVVLVRALHERAGLAAPLLAAVLFMANPYVVTQATRASASLLAYALLPWLLLAAHRGLRRPRGWRWPAVVALCIAAASGGTNAATVVWVVLAPAALVVYELVVLRSGARWRDALALTWRSALLGAVASAWWVVPIVVQGGIAPNFLTFTEQPEAIWRTSTMAESLRLMGFWVSYFEGGFGVNEIASTAVRPYLTSAVVMAGTFLVPLAAFGGFFASRRWRYAPFFALLGVAGLVVMAIGYPTSRPAGRALIDVYYAFPPLQVLRTTYKAGPLVALALAVLAGTGLHQLLAWRARRLAAAPVAWLRLTPLLVVPVVVLWALPLVTGRLIDRPYAYDEVPATWKAALRDADRTTPPGRRLLHLPGQLYTSYRWGRTVTPFTRALTERPVLHRTVIRYADPRGAQLQDAVDDAIQQRRLLPGQLRPLLQLMGVGQILLGTDGDPEQSGERPPAAIADALAEQEDLRRPAQTYGRERRFLPADGEPGAPRRLPELARYPLASTPAAAPVRVKPVGGAAVVDGDGDALLALAAERRLRPERALLYAPDASRARLDEALRGGADLVFSDTNRRRTLTPSRIVGGRGPTIAADEEIPREGAWYELFPDAGTDAQTVAVRGGVVRAVTDGVEPAGEDLLTGANAALDGELSTAWEVPDGASACQCLDLELERPTRLSSIDVHARAFLTGAPQPLGVSLDGGPVRETDVVPSAWTTVRFRPQTVRRIRLSVATPFGPFDLDEVRIPGVRPTSALRLPTTLAAATRGRDLRRSAMSVELERTTADDPWRGDPGRDPERGIVRDVTLPEGRSFTVAGWASATGESRDADLDALAGLDGRWRFESSERYRARPGFRASSAFDGRADTLWAAPYGVDDAPFLSWEGPQELALRRLRLVPGPAEFAAPRRVDVTLRERTFEDLPVARDGTVTLPRTVTTDSARIAVPDVTAPVGRAVDREGGAVAIAEVQVPGLDAPVRQVRGRIASPCGTVEVRAGGSRAPARVTGELERLDRGDPLRVEGCAPLRLPAGTSRVVSPADDVLQADRLSLTAPAPEPVATVAAQAGTVTAIGGAGDGIPDRARVDVRAPAWLVLAQAYNASWRATCEDARGAERDLGEPVPVDGYATGWRVEPGCREVRFAFAPQATANAAYGLSALGGLAVLLLLAWPRRRDALAPVAVPEPPPFDDAAAAVDPPWRPTRAGLAALAAATALVLCPLLTVRVGLGITALLVLLAARGITTRALGGAAVAAVALVLVLYVLAPAGTLALLTASRPVTNTPAHWVAWLAVLALAAAAVREAARQRRATAS